MPEVTKSRIIFNQADWLGTLHPQWDATLLNSVPSGGNLLALAFAMNPYRYLGYAAPGYDQTTVTNNSALTGYLKQGVVGYSNGSYYMYAIENGAKIHQYNIGSATLTTPTTYPHSISNATFYDITLYNIGTTKYGFATYWDSVGSKGNLARIAFGNPDTFIDDYLTNASYLNVAAGWTNSSVALQLPMIVGDNDILYIGTGNTLQQIDGQNGANGTHSANVLTLPKNNVIVGFAKLPLQLVLFTYYSLSGSFSSNVDAAYNGASAKAWFWDYRALDITEAVDLNDPDVAAPFQYSGDYGSTFGIFTQGRSFSISTTRTVKLKIWNRRYEKFETMVVYAGSMPLGPGSVDVVGAEVHWLGALGNSVYEFVWNNNWGQQVGLNLLAQATGNNASAGLLKTVSNTQRIASTGDGLSNYYLQTISSGFSAAAALYTSLVEPILDWDETAMINKVSVQFAKTASGGRSLSLFLYDRLSTSTQFESGLLAITSTNLRKKYLADISSNNFPYYDGLRFVASWATGSGNTDAPAIRQVIVDYKPIKLQN